METCRVARATSTQARLASADRVVSVPVGGNRKARMSPVVCVRTFTLMRDRDASCSACVGVTPVEDGGERSGAVEAR